MGKSTLTFHLLERMKKRFDLVISFTGTAACSPELRKLMEQHWDSRFMFPSWDPDLMARLLKQQEELKGRGIQRQVCVLVDDIIMSSKHEDSLSHLCLRGRHFNVSVMMCAVSYTTLPKRSRRSLDTLFLFSLPMAGDIQLLTQEYAQNSRMARYLLQRLPEWTCLVMETLTPQQKLYHFRACHTELQSEASPDRIPAETEASSETPLQNSSSDRPQKTPDPLSNNESAETHRSALEE